MSWLVFFPFCLSDSHLTQFSIYFHLVPVIVLVSVNQWRLCSHSLLHRLFHNFTSFPPSLNWKKKTETLTHTHIKCMPPSTIKMWTHCVCDVIKSIRFSSSWSISVKILTIKHYQNERSFVIIVNRYEHYNTTQSVWFQLYCSVIW